MHPKPAECDVDQSADLDADIGHHAGHMGGSDSGVRDLCDDGVLQAHQEAHAEDEDWPLMDFRQPSVGTVPR
jgi:hypothetical protein